jgi:hypothetical protein
LLATGVVQDAGNLRVKTLVVAPALALSMVGCLMADERADRLVLMPVEEILVSGSERAGAPLEARFIGLLTNGCQRFERFEVIEAERSAMVSMWAREPKPPGLVCTADIRQVQQARTFRPAVAGSFVITVKQPDGSVLTREVRVE